ARLRESTHDSLAAPPVTVRAAHGRFAGHSPLRSQQAACRAAVTEGALRGAVVVSGWLVRGDSWVESPPRAGYPLDDVPAPPAPRSPRLGSIPDKYGYQRSASAPRIAALADVPSRFAPASSIARASASVRMPPEALTPIVSPTAARSSRTAVTVAPA